MLVTISLISSHFQIFLGSFCAEDFGEGAEYEHVGDQFGCHQCRMLVSSHRRLGFPVQEVGVARTEFLAEVGGSYAGGFAIGWILSDQPLAEEWLQGYMKVSLLSKAGT